ncbi:MAG: helix-turn-helix transcriptional regulator [Actinomycetota bacterium]
MGMKVDRILNMARRRAGLTQRELAELAGVPQPTVSRIERGKTVPTFDTLDRLLEACGMELVVEDQAREDDVDRSLIREWLSWTPEQRAVRAAEEWERTAPFRRAG